MQRRTAACGAIAIACAGALAGAIARADTVAHLVVAEVQVGGTSASDEFVELYNPTAAAIPIDGWRLSKRTGSGAREENLVTSFPTITVAPRASVLVAHPQGAFAASADVRYTTQSALASDNTVVLYGPPDASGARAVVDLVGFGAATSREGTAALNPPSGQSLERKPGGAEGNGQDTNDNAADFSVQAQPTPQSASVAARPTITAPTTDTNTSTSTSTEATNIETTNMDTNTNTTTNTAPPASDTSSASSSSSSSSTPSSSSSSSSLSTPSPSAAAPLPPLKINEFVADPADGDEWIELINTGPGPVNLAGWAVEDGTETRTALTGAIGTGDARFTVIRKPKGQLNNSGDRIVLLAPDGRLADAVSYGDWDDGKVSDNAPAASDPASVARIVDGMDTDDDRVDFVRTELPTPGAPNAIAGAPPEPAGAADGGNARSRPIVVVSELFPNPPGDDLRDEFIEVANVGMAAMDLAGWRLRDALGAEYAITAADGPTALPAGGALAFLRSRTGIALNNTGGETVRLLAPTAERATSVAEYTGAVAEGRAWARGADGRWSWTTEVTPGAANVIATPNRAPDADVAAPDDAVVREHVRFDGSDSADPDREGLTYLWDFGDTRTEADHATGAVGRYAYDRPGTYVARLTVRDPRGGITTAAHRIVIRERMAAAAMTVEEPKPAATTGEPPSAAVRISEFLPNPEGSDTNEWVEVENVGERPVDLLGWTIEVSGGSGTPPRSAIRDAVVPGGGFVLVRRPILRAAIRNDGGTVVLRDAAGAPVDAVTYGRAPSGRAYARASGRGWAWAAPTPAAANAAPDAPLLVTGTVAPRVAGWQSAPRTLARIADAVDADVGDRVTVRGTVTAPLGSVGKSILYIADPSGGSPTGVSGAGAGIQVYVGSRAIPPAGIGDVIAVTGEIREVGGERRIGIARAEDVRAVGHGTSLEAVPLRAQDARPDLLGSLVTVEGDVVEVRGRTVSVDDGSEEIRIALPANADAEAITRLGVGDAVRATGILSQSRSGFRVLARSASDVTAVAREAKTAAAVRAPPPRALDRRVELGLLGAAAALLTLVAFRGRFRPRTASAITGQ